MTTTGNADTTSEYRDIHEMSFDELTEELANVSEKITNGGIETSAGSLPDRRRELWDAVKRQIDEDTPECPDCQANSWGIGVLNPFACLNCGRGVSEDSELATDIEDFWDTVFEAADIDYEYR